MCTVVSRLHNVAPTILPPVSHSTKNKKNVTLSTMLINNPRSRPTPPRLSALPPSPSVAHSRRSRTARETTTGIRSLPVSFAFQCAEALHGQCPCFPDECCVPRERCMKKMGSPVMPCGSFGDEVIILVRPLRLNLFVEK
jgi:hypothetical protein